MNWLPQDTRCSLETRPHTCQSDQFSRWSGSHSAEMLGGFWEPTSFEKTMKTLHSHQSRWRRYCSSSFGLRRKHANESDVNRMPCDILRTGMATYLSSPCVWVTLLRHLTIRHRHPPKVHPEEALWSKNAPVTLHRPSTRDF